MALSYNINVTYYTSGMASLLTLRDFKFQQLPEDFNDFFYAIMKNIIRVGMYILNDQKNVSLNVIIEKFDETR